MGMVFTSSGGAKKGQSGEHALRSEATGRIDTDCLRISQISSLFG